MTKCAAIQMASSPNISFNLLEAGKLIAEAVNGGAKLVALPENFALMGDHETDKLKAKEVDGSGPIQAFLSETAKKHAVWIIGGTIPLVADDSNKVRAACLVYNDKGERVGRYDKIHLFDVNVPGTNEVYRESDSIEPGTESQVFDTPFGKLGIAVCYDLRFPVWNRNTWYDGVYGYDLLVCLANWPASRSHVWKTLLVARAIENQTCVAGVNRIGNDGHGTWHSGDTMAIDAKGNVLYAALEGIEEIRSIAYSARDLKLFRDSFTVGMDWDHFTITNL